MIERIKDWVFSDIESEGELVETIETFRDFANRLEAVYHIRRVLKGLVDEETVNETMEEVKTLDVKEELHKTANEI